MNYLKRKYMALMRGVNFQGYLQKASGNPSVLTACISNSPMWLSVFGNSIQDGTPTPESPVEIQSVGDLTTKNLFDMNKLIEQGWVQQVDGSYYVEKSSTPYQQVLWENAENYTGQLKILFKVKYSLDNKPGCYLWVNYTDGTHLNVAYQDGKIVADTWYSPTISRTITDTNKTVKNVTWVYGATISSTWVKDIIITKDIAVTEYEPYHKYDIPIVVRGKNLIKYPYATASRTMNGVKYTVNKDGSVTVVGTATAASYFILNTNADFGNSSIPENSTNGVYATSEGVKYNVSNHTVSINVASGETVDKIVYPQIEYGTTATEYEPYQGSETIHIYLDKPLCKFGDYTDYIDFKNKKVVRNVVVGVLNGSESWSSSVTRYYHYNTKLNIKCLGTTVAGIMSNALPSKSWTEIRNSGTGIATYTNGTLHNRIDIRADGIWTSVDKAKEYMKNNPIQYIAHCLVPTEEDISLPALKALKGTNVISVDTSVIPSNMECEYYSTTKQEEE